MAGAPCPVKHGLRRVDAAGYPAWMSGKKQGGLQADRAARLAEQLRANLRKRKAQGRDGAAGDSGADKRDE